MQQPQTHPSSPSEQRTYSPYIIPQEIPHLSASRTQKVLMISALILTLCVILATPCIVLVQAIFSDHTAQSSFTEAYTLTNLNATAIANAKAAPDPLGTVIQPLQQQIMTGVSMPGDLTAIQNFEKDAGKNVSVLLSYQPWGVTNGEQEFPAAWASTVRQHGSIPLITWEPWTPEAYPADDNEPTFSLKNIIHGKFDTYIKKWAEDAKAWKYPFFLRFAPEMNGNWVPWSEGLNGNKPGEFVQAWRHVHNIFVAVGTTNATWMWCPNITFSESLPIAPLYPGNAYVNWVGMDGFNWGTTTNHPTWLTFSQVFSQTYQEILTLTTKPMMIVETGSTQHGGNEAAWIINAYSIALPHDFPMVKGIVWFNQKTQEDWRIEASPAIQAAFSTAIKAPIYASNIFAHYFGG